MPTIKNLLRTGFVFILWLMIPCCSSDTSEPKAPPSLQGTWDLIGFTDAGMAAVTTGVAEFRANATFSIDGTVTFPGEPTDTIAVAGTYLQSSGAVDLTIDQTKTTWILDFSGDQVTLTESEPPPANTMTLRRR